MKKQRPFARQLSIRLSDDGTGFLYTVSYGWLRLPARHIQLFERGEGIAKEVPAISTRQNLNKRPATRRRENEDE
jgi:hypothetical protein